MSLSFTGERFVPECAGEMVYEHWHRYLIAQHHVAGKRVLDIPCGEGYGSHLLARHAGSVVGVDISADAVTHAATRYPRENLRYVAADCTRIPEPDASFDVIVSFEMIEHILAQEEFLSEAARLLKPDGLFIISSPNRPEYTDKTGYQNEFHVKELDRPELKALLDAHFPAQRWFAQRAAFHSMVWPLDATATRAEALSIQGGPAWPEPLYFLVFCANELSTLRQVPSDLTLVTDAEQSVYAEWSRTYRENAMLHDKVRAMEAQPPASATGAAQVEPSAPVAESWLVRLARQITG
ncbi:MAG: class I SAM-dependent methyltransferase [Burkholderiales bacterium]|nr:class I SAM-dependent methyltransferase [Burkholderiales bacterium]